MGMEYWAGFGDSPKPLNVIRTLYDSFVDDDDTDVGEHDDYESGYEIFTQEWNSKAPLTLLDPSPFWSELVWRIMSCLCTSSHSSNVAAIGRGRLLELVQRP